ncbi:hypothetical protein IS125_0490, partial [Staphylococcus aureus subsp. aureus IS-125]
MNTVSKGTDMLKFYYNSVRNRDKQIEISKIAKNTN